MFQCCLLFFSTQLCPNGVFSTCRGMIKIACALRHHPETAAAASCSQVHQYFDQLLLILNVCIICPYIYIYSLIDNYNVPFELILMDWKVSQLFWLGLYRLTTPSPADSCRISITALCSGFWCTKLQVTKRLKCFSALHARGVHSKCVFWVTIIQHVWHILVHLLNMQHPQYKIS